MTGQRHIISWGIMRAAGAVVESRQVLSLWAACCPPHSASHAYGPLPMTNWMNDLHPFMMTDDQMRRLRWLR